MNPPPTAFPDPHTGPSPTDDDAAPSDAAGSGVLDAPFSGLNPDLILDALAAFGFDGDGRLLQLNSFENRVFQVMLHDGSAVVAKFYRPARWNDAQILEEHAFSQEVAAEEIPLVAPLAFEQDPPGTSGCERLGPSLGRVERDGRSWRLAVWPRRAGRTPEFEDPEVLQRLGGTLARLHEVGARRPFRHRHTMDPPRDARSYARRIEATERVPPDQTRAWADSCTMAIESIEACVATSAPVRSIRLHGDCHPGNLLWRDDRPNLVDLDDACNGPPVQDLWMLLSGEAEAARWQLDQLLAGYRAWRPFDDGQQPLLAALRLLRLLRHNAWVADRWNDPAFPLAYPDFGSSGYWAQQAMQLRELVTEALDMAGRNR